MQYNKFRHYGIDLRIFFIIGVLTAGSLSAQHGPRHLSKPDPIVALADGDLVVGFPNPNEVREITTPLEVDGNVIIVGNGTLRINGSSLLVRGNVHLLQNGRLEVQGGKLEFHQQFLYQRAVTVGNKAVLWLNASTLACGGYNLNIAVSDTAVLRYDGSTVADGIATTVLDKHAAVDANDSQNLGEFLYFDNARGSFQGCANLLSWLTLPVGSSVETTLPGSLVLDAYAFPDSAAVHAGVGYRVAFNGCTGLLWALMLEPGCTATVRESELLAVGAMFRGTGSATVSGLVNNATMDAARFPAQDREVRFEMCSVRVWNLYSFDTFRLSVSNCIFGEIITFGRSEATVQNSLCDGSGGYVGAFDDSRLNLVQSQISARVIARGRAQIITLASTLAGDVLHAADNGVLALFHSAFPALPSVDAGAAAGIIAVDEPRQASVEALVPVHGTVRFLAGAEVPVHFVSYWLSAAQSSNPDLELWKSARSIVQRYRDTIGLWDTRGFTPGDYLLTVHMRLSSDDTLRIPASVRLTEATVSVRPSPDATRFSIEAVYPQPARAGLPISVSLAPEVAATVVLRDVLGREVYRGDAQAGGLVIPTAGLVPGAYILDATHAGETHRRIIQVLR